MASPEQFIPDTNEAVGTFKGVVYETILNANRIRTIEELKMERNGGKHNLHY